jgi:hypothetical protein
MRSRVHRGRSMVLGLLLAVALPGAAQAAVEKPTVTTKAASNVQQSTALLNGAVDPNGAETTYFFQIGPTSVYGINSPETGVGKGGSPVNVSFQSEGLAPATTYHYRIVAKNSKGLVKGSDRTFKTRRQPLGLVLNATENPIRFNAFTTLTGQLTGTGNANQQVVLQSNPFPYSQGFASTGNALVTNPDGGFAFLLPPVTINTQYRVLMPEKPSVVSPIVSLGVKVRVLTKAKPGKVRKGRRVRFSGTVVPAADGAQVLVQKLVNNVWTNVAETVTRHLDGASSSYRRRVKVRKSGSYRILVNVTDGAHVPNIGRTIKIRVRR